MSTEEKNTTNDSRSAALERLRDRTDELELIISSLTIFALFSLPSWLFNLFSTAYTHLSDGLVIAGTIGLTLASGVSYALAACFVVHLMARAYWVGLIGLRTVFPEGINWGRTPGIGPITRHRLKQNLPDLESAIQRTDRLASSLFAIISLITLGMLWMGAIMLITFVVAVQIGVRFGLTNAAIGVAAALLIAVYGGIPLLVWVLDSVLARRISGLQSRPWFSGIVNVLARFNAIVYPQRLILPVQLTLQSNTRPVIFYLGLIVSVAAIIVVGNTRFTAWRNFTISGEFTYLDSDTAAAGFRSAYYEDMSSPKDRIRAWPRIASFTQKGRFVTLFLPYQPLRDNLMLNRLCPDGPDADSGVDCLRDLWSVSINGTNVSLSSFDTAERMDLNMRGLIGLVPMSGLEPGMHSITVIWNPVAADSEDLVDDRYTANSQTFRIPIAFAPEYELTLPHTSP